MFTIFYMIYNNHINQVDQATLPVKGEKHTNGMDSEKDVKLESMFEI